MAFLRTSRKIISVCSSTPSAICESGEGFFLRPNANFYIEDIVRYASLEHSAQLTTNTRVIRCVVIKDLNADVLMPTCSPLAFLYLQCLFD